jgi:hypothetical protein
MGFGIWRTEENSILDIQVVFRSELVCELEGMAQVHPPDGIAGSLRR